jgi:hypothetical protein
MADELTLALQYTYAKVSATAPTMGTVSFLRAVNALVDVTGTVSTAAVITVGTADEVLAAGDVPTAAGSSGYLLVRNLDITPTVAPVNYILLGHDGTTYQIRLKGGLADGSVEPDFAILRWNLASNSIHVKAVCSVGTACMMEYILLPD